MLIVDHAEAKKFLVRSWTMVALVAEENVEEMSLKRPKEFASRMRSLYKG